ncbi:MAG: DUF4395 family protein [Angelakisella sp.]
MTVFKPAAITKGSFAFCRATVAILLWLSILLRSVPLLFVVFLIMLFSAIFKVERAPLILLYRFTADRLHKSETIVVDERGIFFSHVVGSVFAALCLILLFLFDGLLPWVVTGLFAVLQTSAAFGFCSALKLYNCMNNGTCCRVGRFAKKVRDHV